MVKLQIVRWTREGVLEVTKVLRDLILGAVNISLMPPRRSKQDALLERLPGPVEDLIKIRQDFVAVLMRIGQNGEIVVRLAPRQDGAGECVVANAKRRGDVSEAEIRNAALAIAYSGTTRRRTDSGEGAIVTKKKGARRSHRFSGSGSSSR